MKRLILISSLTALLFVGCGEKDKTAEEWKAYYKTHQEEAKIKNKECKEDGTLKRLKPNSFEEAQNPPQEYLECKAAMYAAWERPIIGNEKDIKPWKNL